MAMLVTCMDALKNDKRFAVLLASKWRKAQNKASLLPAVVHHLAQETAPAASATVSDSEGEVSSDEQDF